MPPVQLQELLCVARPAPVLLSVTGSQAHRLLSHQTVADEEDVTTQQIAARRVTRGREPSTGVGTHVTVGFTEQRMLRLRLEGKAAATCYWVAVGWDRLCSGEAERSLPLALRPSLLPAPCRRRGDGGFLPKASQQ